MSNTLTKPHSLPYKTLLCIAFAQGIALLLLHVALDENVWPHGDPHWLLALYSAALSGPTMLLLSISGTADKRIILFIGGFTFTVFLLAFYTGSQISLVRSGWKIRQSVLIALVVTAGIACFKALNYAQCYFTKNKITYSLLYQYAWRNFLTLALAQLLTLCIAIVLLLWAMLFTAVGVDFFGDLFTTIWFVYPMLGLANGFGIIIFRQQSTIIDTITHIQRALLKFILVILLFVSVLFLATLLFTGLEPLWDSGGSNLILWLQALTLFSLNSVYQKNTDTNPYPIWLHRAIYIGLATLPVYSIISFYGLYVRIDQYGWSISRCWAALIASLLFLFSAGYLWKILQLRDNWVSQLGWINIRVGLVLLLSMVLVNSPLLDFRKISVASQIAMLENGKKSLQDFDIHYFDDYLADPGQKALAQLKKVYINSHPEFVMRLNGLHNHVPEQSLEVSKELFISTIELIDTELPETLAQHLFARVNDNKWAQTDIVERLIFSVDLDKNQTLDFILIERNQYNLVLTLFYLNDNGDWISQSLPHTYWQPNTIEPFLAAIRRGNIKTQETRWHQLIIDEKTIKVN